MLLDLAIYSFSLRRTEDTIVRILFQSHDVYA